MPDNDTSGEDRAGMSNDTPTQTARRVLVCGGRDYTNASRIGDVLYAEHVVRPIGLLIHGVAHGTDALAARWANVAGVPTRAFAAEWSQHGRSAGPIRNQRMLDECRPDLVIAFPGGRGTADMTRRARAAGVPVEEIQ